MTRIICIGDAITRGTNREASGAFPATITSYSWRRWLWHALRETGKEVDFVGPHTLPDFPDVDFDQANCAFGGTTTIEWMGNKIASLRLADAEAKAAGKPTIAPQIAVILIGTEDAYQQTPMATRKGEMLSLLNDLLALYPQRCFAMKFSY